MSGAGTTGADFKGIRARFFVLLGILLVLAGAQALIVERAREARRALAATVDLAGRQRMLTQRAAWTAHRLVASPAADRGALRESLRETASQMLRAHERLRTEVDAAVPYAGEGGLDRRVRAFTDAARRFAGTPDAQLGPDDPHLLALAAEAEGGMVDALEEALQAHERAGRRRLARIDLDQHLLLAALVLVFVLLWRLAFRPLVARLREKVKALDAANAQLGVRVSKESAAALHQAAALAVSEETLRDQSRLLEAVVESMQDALVVIDRTERVLVANPEAERLFGRREHGTLREWIADVTVLRHEEDDPIPYERRPIVRSLREGRGVAATGFLPATGSRADVWISARAQPLQDERGRIVGALAVSRDITAARGAEERLRQAQKMEAVGQLTGGLAHDFNNLLTVILGNLELLGEAPPPADLPQLVRAARDAATRGAGLTRSLLAFSRRQALRPRVVDVSDLVAGMSHILARTLGEAVDLRARAEPGLWPTLVDPHQLEAAILNLALNARDAMPGGGKLTLETANARVDAEYARSTGLPPGPYVVLAVSDTGQGMDPDVVERAFEPFFSTKGPGQGTGLGLSMVYGFVKQSGGHVRVYSEKGQGTTVRIYLPRAEEGAEQSEEVAPATLPMRGGHETVLVVEDDTFVREVAVRFLTDLGYRTLEAQDADEALAVIAREAVDVLFTDIVLPGGAGDLLARTARTRRRGLKVLFTSGYAANAVTHHGRLDPGVHLISKPYGKAELAAALRRVIEGV